MKKIGIILAVFVALIVYDIYNIPLPDGANDTFRRRLFFYLFKIGSLKVRIDDSTIKVHLLSNSMIELSN